MKFTYVSPQALDMLEEAYGLGIGVEELKDLAKSARSWTAFRSNLGYWVDEARRRGDGKATS